MKKPFLKLKDIKTLGFEYLGKEYLEDGDFYRWWKLQKNDSEIHITYSFKSNSDFQSGYVELNGEMLKGRELTKQDIERLIEIM